MSSAQSKEQSKEQSTLEAVQGAVQDYAARPVEMVREHPIPASLVLFGLGLGLGLILTSQAPDSMFHQETTTERLSRQFNDSMSDIRSMLQRGFASIRG